MPKVTAVIAALVLLFGLAGCASVERQELTPQSTEKASAAPLEAEAPEEPVELGTDAAYLSDVRSVLEAYGGSRIPNATDAQLITAGRDACDQMLEGADALDVRVVEGEDVETGFDDSLRIAGTAVKHFCPEVRPED